MQQKIYKNTFKGCTSLKHLSIPHSVLSIDDCACQDCTSLTGINMGSDLKFIGTSAFCGDVSLSSVSRLNGENVKDPAGNPNTFDVVGNYAFAGTGLVSADLALRSSAIQTFWGDGCFQNCKKLESVHFLSANYMSRNMFKGCTSLSSVDYDVPMMAYTYPGIFDGCTSLKSIELPAQLLFVPEQTFNGCSSLNRVAFNTYGQGSTIDEIQKDAYYNTKSLSQIELPESIDSLSKLDQECFRGANFRTVKFHGIQSDQISVMTEYNIPASDADVRLNTWNWFEESYYGLFSSYSDYVNSNIDDEDYLISEDEYNAEVQDERDNYTTIQSIISAAADKKIPVLVAIGINHQNDDMGGSYYTPQDLTYIGALNDSFWYGSSMMGGVYPSSKLSVKIGSTNFKCKYVNDDDLMDAFLQGNGCIKDWNDPEFIKECKSLGYTDEEIAKYSNYMRLGETKQQLSAVFISYNIDIGPVVAWTESDWEREFPDDNPSRYISQLKTAIQKRLTVLTGKLTGTLRDSGFKSINQSFFKAVSGVDSRLKTYGNYGMICVRNGSSITVSTGITIPDSKLSSDRALDELADGEQTKIYDAAVSYEDSHPDSVLSYWVYFISNAGEDEYGDILNGKCVTELKKQIGKNGYAITNLDRYFMLPSGKYLEDTVLINKCNMVDLVMKTGFFGRKGDVSVWCKDMPEGQTFRYLYDRHYYDPPERKDYKSDKDTTVNFKTGVWYYRSREIHTEARQRGIPCLFIYSLFGCGPCSIYQKELWNNDEFQEWFKKQKFLMCGLECEQQPMYDDSLRFLVDDISVNAENFAKEDMGESMDSKPANALNAKFRRYAVGNSYASTLMTPVLVFMDKDGKCWDYSYHNISNDIRRYGSSGMIQRLKSLCLYHFDRNSLNNPTYVIDAGKAFDPSDYREQVDNPWLVGSDIMNMSINAHDYGYVAAMTPLQLKKGMIDILMTVPQYAAVMAGKDSPYLAGCIMGNIPWITSLYDLTELEKYTKAEDLTKLFEPWYFKIDELYYKMKFDPDDKVQIDNPCAVGEKEYIYKISFEQIKYGS